MNIADVKDIPLDDIRLQGTNVRSDLSSAFSQEGIHELAENIRINGLLQPVVLRGDLGNPPYDVIVGQRRFLAHNILAEKGLLPNNTIKATFSGKIDDMSALLLSLSENMCRQEMNYEDTSNAITTLYKHFGNDERKVQAHTGFSLRMIRNYVRIEEQATDKIKQLLKDRRISMPDAKRAIDAAQGDSEKADVLIDEIVKLTTYQKKRLVESGAKNPKASANALIEAAKQPKLEETIILNLPHKVHKALKTAAEKLAIEMEELTTNALVHWLKTNEFLIEE